MSLVLTSSIQYVIIRTNKERGCMEKIECARCDKMITQGVENGNGDIICQECAEYLDGFYQDMETDSRSARW